jgi:DNA-binding beta-propeller fold protein YncE
MPNARTIAAFFLATIAIIPPSNFARGEAVVAACTQPSASMNAGETIRATLAASEPADVTVRVFDAQNRFIRCIAGKAMKPGEKLAVEWNVKDSFGQRSDPGEFTLRVEAGMTLTLDKTFGKDGVLTGSGETAFISPTHIAVDHEGNLYILDYANSTVYKFHPDGKPANDWDDSNAIHGLKKGKRGRAFTSVAIDDRDRLLIPVAHSVGVWNTKTGEPYYSIGGFFKDDPQAKINAGGLGWPVLAFGGNGRIYVSCPSYNILAAFNGLNKPGFEGALWSAGRSSVKPVWQTIGAAGDFDGQNGLYFSSSPSHRSATLFKVIDAGDHPAAAYSLTKYLHPGTGAKQTISDINAISSDRKGVLFVLLRASQQILKVVDPGDRFEVVAQLGSRGPSAEKIQFVGPHGLALTPAGDALYVAEDGDRISDDEETLGQARVTKYLVKYKAVQDVKLTVKP